MAQHLAKADLEALLRTRKLDHTLPAALEHPFDEQAVVATGFTDLDRRLAGGLPRGQMSEIVGTRSSGRTSLLLSTLASATGHGEAVALVDPLDMLDPPSAAEHGLDLGHLLWIRGVPLSVGSPDAWFRDTRSHWPSRGEEAQALDRALERAVKAVNLVLQAGGFGVVALDLGEVPPASVKRLPFTTWLRLERVIEGSKTVCLLLGGEPIARSAGGVTLLLNRADSSEESPAGVDARMRVGAPHPRGVVERGWLRRGSKPRLFLGFDVEVRIVHVRWRGDEMLCQVRIGAESPA